MHLMVTMSLGLFPSFVLKTPKRFIVAKIDLALYYNFSQLGTGFLNTGNASWIH
jgi:hypothetical protein